MKNFRYHENNSQITFTQISQLLTFESKPADLVPHHPQHCGVYFPPKQGNSLISSPFNPPSQETVDALLWSSLQTPFRFHQLSEQVSVFLSWSRIHVRDTRCMQLSYLYNASTPEHFLCLSLSFKSLLESIQAFPSVDCLWATSTQCLLMTRFGSCIFRQNAITIIVSCSQLVTLGSTWPVPPLVRLTFPRFLHLRFDDFP